MQCSWNMWCADLNGTYQTYLSRASETNNYSNFKRAEEYTKILEHLSKEDGVKYLSFLQSKLSDVIIQEYCSLNDKIGNAVIYDYGRIKSSPNSLRYALHAYIILEHFKNMRSSPSEEIHIVEIGGGYGGLCLAINELNKIFGLNVSSYAIIDLKGAIKLQEYYLNNFKLSFETSFHDCETFGKNITSDRLYLISNYAFSELTPLCQRHYKEALFSKVVHGFFVWNRIYDGRDSSIINFPIVKEEDEYPATGTGTSYIYF